MYEILTLALFIAMIAMLIINKPERHWVGLILLIILIASGAMYIDDFFKYIEWDVLGLVLCMHIYLVFLERSGGASHLARYLVKKINSPTLLSFIIILIAGIISIVLDNVTTVLIIAPIAYKLTSRIKLDQVALIIGITLSANMAGSATMIGDPPAIITAGHYKLDFMDFIIYDGKPSMFFMTLIPMIVSTYVYTILSVKPGKLNNVQNMVDEDTDRVDKTFVYESLLFLAIQILLLSFRKSLNILLTEAALINVCGLALTRIIIHRDRESVRKALVNGFEWKTIMFLAGVFLLSGAFEKHGLAKELAETFLTFTGDLFYLTTLLIWFSVAVSAVLDNTPYVTTMIPVIDVLAGKMGVDPIVLAWALLLGTTLGGGITYIGATANVVGVRFLENKGYRISFIDFVRKSLVFNIVNVLTGWFLYIVFWI